MAPRFMTFIRFIFCSIILLSLSFCLTFYSHPGNSGFAELVWICLLPVFLLLELNITPRKKSISAIILGSWGLFWWCSAIWWIIPAATGFIGLEKPLAITIWACLCLFLSLPYFITGILWTKLSYKNAIVDICAKSILFTTLVSLSIWIIPANLAHSLFEQTLSIQIVSITGMSGLLLFIVVFNMALAKGFSGLFKKPHATFKKQHVAPAFVLALVSISLLHIIGFSLLNLPSKTPRQTLTIGYVQPNLVRSDKVQSVIEQTRTLVKDQPNIDLIVWPELPIAFSWQESQFQQRLINQLLKDINIPLLLNSGYVYGGEDLPKLASGKQYFSAAQLISPQGELQGSYNKQSLVPFFEYIPFEYEWPALRNYFPHTYKYAVGPNKSPIAYRFGENNEEPVLIAPLICYEMIFSPLSRNLKQKNASIFINPSNDAWFSDTNGSIRHFALATFRSVENRTPWVRVNNSGVSGATTQYGEIIEGSSIPLNEKAERVITVEISKEQSFYSRFGEVFLMLLTLLSLGFIFRLYPFKAEASK